ncbi:response regulator [bacterium]|nr:response regulator [bacterium]
MADEESSLRIGVFDDSNTARMVTQRLLTRAGYQAFLVESVSQLLQVIEQLDLLLMDLSLGDEDGREVARTLRQRGGAAARLPLIAVTAFADPQLKNELQEAGFADYLHKPFRPQELYDKIERWANLSPPDLAG